MCFWLKLVVQYPFVAKTLRDMNRKIHEGEQQHHSHCCSMMLQNQGLGYKDLDQLLANSCDLEFTVELLSVQLPQEYDKDTWQMADDEKLIKVSLLRIEGNTHYQEKKYVEAEECYRNAVGLLEQLMLK